MANEAERAFAADDEFEDLDILLDVNRGTKTQETSFFALSGGIIKRDARTANRIDSLLMRMMESCTGTAYSAKIDKNLDYLHTSLQLDMITMFAETCRPRYERQGREDHIIEE